jgi:hypothetical protein
MHDRLRAMLEDAARGRFPPPDGTLTVLPEPAGRADAVVAFTAHAVLAADVSPEEALAHLPSTDLGAPTDARFLAWLGERLGTAPGSLDVVLAAGRDPASAGIELRRASVADHDRVDRAGRYREEVEVFTDPDGVAVVIVGRGLALRREVALEIDASSRSAGLGRRLLRALRASIPPDEVVFAQVAPGNAASLRAFLAAGFTPIGAEVLFLRDGSP